MGLPGWRGYDHDMSRAEDAARRADLEAAAVRSEAAQAQVLIDAFVTEAQAKGIAPIPLRATLYTGQSVKTDKRGWYLRKNESLAIGDDGAYYILTVPGGPEGAAPRGDAEAVPAPMYVGKGGKDGDTGDLRGYLDRILSALSRRQVSSSLRVRSRCSSPANPTAPGSGPGH